MLESGEPGTLPRIPPRFVLWQVTPLQLQEIRFAGLQRGVEIHSKYWLWLREEDELSDQVGATKKSCFFLSKYSSTWRILQSTLNREWRNKYRKAAKILYFLHSTWDLWGLARGASLAELGGCDVVATLAVALLLPVPATTKARQYCRVGAAGRSCSTR